MTRDHARPGPILRDFLPADQAKAKALILCGLEEHIGVLDSRYNRDLVDITRAYLARGGVFIVADWEGDIVGTGGLLRDKLDAWRMVRVSVDIGWRLRGLGGAIVEHLIERATVLGGVRIWVETNDDWHDAIGLYRRHGFSEIRRFEGNLYLERVLGVQR